MSEVFDLAMLKKKLSQLEEQLADKQKEVDYYKKIAREAGHKRVLEVYQMTQLIEERKIAEKEREKVIEDLKIALDEVKTLQGLIPICASCKKIRDDKGYWNQIEIYIQEHSEATFSHGLCPDCMEKLYPEQYRELKQRRQEIVAVLKKLGQASLTEIATAVHLPENNTLNRLQMMAKEGQVKCLEVAGEKLYSLEPEIN